MVMSVITAVSNLFAGVFKFKTAKIENLACVEVVEDKKDYKKAVDIAEKIITIADKYKFDMTFSHRLRFCHLVEDFKRYN